MYRSVTWDMSDGKSTLDQVMTLPDSKLLQIYNTIGYNELRI